MNHQTNTTKPTPICKCINPQIGAYSFLGIIKELGLYKQSWRAEIAAYSRYIKGYMTMKFSYIELFSLCMTPLGFKSHISWFTECKCCKKAFDFEMPKL